MIARCSAEHSFPHPRNVVVGVIEERQESISAANTLRRFGFTASDIHLFHGKEDAECMDADGKHLHGIRHAARYLHWLLSEEGPMLSEYEAEARVGHHIVFVRVHLRGRVRRAAVVQAIHQAYSMRHFGRWLITDLSATSPRHGIPVG